MAQTLPTHIVHESKTLTKVLNDAWHNNIMWYKGSIGYINATVAKCDNNKYCVYHWIMYGKAVLHNTVLFLPTFIWSKTRGSNPLFYSPNKLTCGVQLEIQSCNNNKSFCLIATASIFSLIAQSVTIPNSLWYLFIVDNCMTLFSLCLEPHRASNNSAAWQLVSVVWHSCINLHLQTNIE